MSNKSYGIDDNIMCQVLRNWNSIIVPRNIVILLQEFVKFVKFVKHE